MITFEEAIKIVLSQSFELETEVIFFEEAPGRVLASDLKSDMDMPPFNKSAMDGFACKREDLGDTLEIIDVIRAGVAPERSIGKGQCAQIMTGAILPEGADTVIKVEECSLLETETGGSRKVRFLAENSSPNICYRGEDIRIGQVVIEKGTLLEARHVPILAAIGAVRIPVFRLPSVGILSTGTELVEPNAFPGISKIRNSNAYQMIAQLGKIGIECDYYGIASDDEDVTRKMIAEGIEQNDMLILSGGISMGEFDFVPSVLESIGFTIEFRQLAIQPGKPTIFAKSGGKFIFCLPGNPVSSFFLLELLIKPFIFHFMGHTWTPPVFRLKTGVRITRKKSNRLSWIPVRIEADGLVYPVDYHGSAHIFALRDAFGIVPIPIGVLSIEEGDQVDVRLF